MLDREIGQLPAVTFENVKNKLGPRIQNFQIQGLALVTPAPRPCTCIRIRCVNLLSGHNVYTQYHAYYYEIHQLQSVALARCDH